jgi:glycosyltransferase involved in cell wall biosynthesis
MAPSLRPTQRLLTMGHGVATVAPNAAHGDHLVYTASDNPSNQQALTWLLREVWPHVLAERPAARLRITGLICDVIAGTPLAETTNIELAGFVPAPVEELQAAAIVVAPYLYGSGLKIKVLEAAAAGRPVVTTSGGLEGTGMTPGEQLLVEDTPVGFARAIVRLLDSPTLRAAMGETARQFVERAFSEEACYAPLLELIRGRAEAPTQPGVIPPAVGTRLRAALDVLDAPQVVVWGNGSHTRSLVSILSAMPATIRCIVDKSAAGVHDSVEGIRVVPAAQFACVPGDLIVLSSQSFEAEMWEDLQPIRKARAHVLALYRADLVTEPLQTELQALLHRRARRPAAPIGAASSPRGRLIIVEPSGGRSNGPFFRLARAIRESSHNGHTEVIVAGARVPVLRGLEPADHELLDQAFEFAYWDILQDLNGDTWTSVCRYARCVARDLERLGQRLELTADDTVLFHTANIVEVLGATHWLASLPSDRLPGIRLLFHFPPEQEANWLRLTDAEVQHAYALALALLTERAGDRLRILAQTVTLAQVLEKKLRQPVDPIGFPVPARLRDASQPFPASPARLLYAGEARSDKGFNLLPAVADALDAELRAGRLTLVCQSTMNELADDAIRRATAALKARPGVEVIDRFLPSPDYDRLVAGCDLVLLPYDAQRYRARLSAVFVDATCAGVLPIVPNHTWMSEQLSEGYGVGATFSTLTPKSIALAVRKSLRDIATLKQQARVASDRVWRRHDPRRVLETILAP